MKISEQSPPVVFLTASPGPLSPKKGKVSKDTVLLKSTTGAYTHESVAKRHDPSFDPAVSAIPMQWKSSSTVVVLNSVDAKAPPQVTTLEKAWKNELMQRDSVTLWNALQCDVDCKEAAEDDMTPCTFGMKTAIIYIPDKEVDEAMFALIAAGWAPKKSTRWTSVWSVNEDGVFMPLGGLWLLSAKALTIPCDLA